MTETLAVRLVDDSVEIDVSLACYSLDVAQRAAIKFTGLASFGFADSQGGSVTVRISTFSDSGISSGELAKLFTNELLDQALRERIANETAVERNLILAHAFSKSKIGGS